MTMGTIVNEVLTMNEHDFISTMEINTQRIGADVLPTLTITVEIWSKDGYFNSRQAQQLLSLNSSLEVQSDWTCDMTPKDSYLSKEMVFHMSNFFVVTKCTLQDD